MISKKDPVGLLIITILAGMAGFEPAHTGTKNRCLTTWRHPIVIIKLQFINKSS